MSTEISTNTTPARGLALASFADAMKFSETVSSSEFAPKDFRGKPASCMLAIQCGAEVGLAPLQALQSIAVVNGRPAVYGDAALALVKASHVCEYVTEAVEGEGDQMVATCTAKRRGYPSATVVRFTVADAKKASLWGKTGPWTQYPKRMLQMRARGFALRDCFPDVLKGLVTAEEAQDYPQTPEPPKPVVVTQEHGKAGGVYAEFIKPADAAPKADAVATEADLQKSRLAVSRAKDISGLERMQATVEGRLRSGFYTPGQADELLNLINGKIDYLSCAPEDRGQEFPHEAANHEVAS